MERHADRSQQEPGSVAQALSRPGRCVPAPSPDPPPGQLSASRSPAERNCSVDPPPQCKHRPGLGFLRPGELGFSLQLDPVSGTRIRMVQSDRKVWKEKESDHLEDHRCASTMVRRLCPGTVPAMPSQQIAHGPQTAGSVRLNAPSKCDLLGLNSANYKLVGLLQLLTERRHVVPASSGYIVS